MHLATVVELAAHRYPEADAVIDHARRLSYGVWNRRIDAVAQGLVRMGLRPGDRVALCAANSEPAATAIFAVYKAGGTAVSLNARWKRAELAYALEDAGVTAVAYDAATAGEVLPAAGACGREIFQIALDPQAFESLAREPADGPPRVPRDPAAVGTILYTSGTTGRPKGVCRTHQSDYHAALAMAVEHGWRRFERTLAVMPLYHTMGLHTLLALVVLNGAGVLIPRFRPAECLEWVTTERLSTLYLVPTTFHDLVEHVRATGDGAPRVRTLVYAGAPMAPELVGRCRETFRPDVFINHYGCTEMHVIATNADLVRKPGAAGRPALHTRLRIVPADRGTRHGRVRRVSPREVLPPGETGEVIVDASSPQAFTGYLNRPDATGAAVREGWYFTGDLGVLDADGDLHLLGRVDDVIISGGENITPDEVERVLLRHPLVRDAAVVGLPDGRWGETVAAFVVPATDDLDREALERHCLESPDLARYKRPRRYVFTQEIPRSPAGKTLRALLKSTVPGG